MVYHDYDFFGWAVPRNLSCASVELEPAQIWITVDAEKF